MLHWGAQIPSPSRPSTLAVGRWSRRSLLLVIGAIVVTEEVALNTFEHEAKTLGFLTDLQVGFSDQSVDTVD